MVNSNALVAWALASRRACDSVTYWGLTPEAEKTDSRLLCDKPRLPATLSRNTLPLHFINTSHPPTHQSTHTLRTRDNHRLQSSHGTHGLVRDRKTPLCQVLNNKKVRTREFGLPHQEHFLPLHARKCFTDLSQKSRRASTVYLIRISNPLLTILLLSSKLNPTLSRCPSDNNTGPFQLLWPSRDLTCISHRTISQYLPQIKVVLPLWHTDQRCLTRTTTPNTTTPQALQTHMLNKDSNPTTRTRHQSATLFLRHHQPTMPMVRKMPATTQSRRP